MNFATYSGQCTSQLARLRFFDLHARRKLSVWCAVRTLDGFLSASAMNSIISGTCVIFGDAYIHQGRNLQKNHSKSCSRTKVCTKPSLRGLTRRICLLRNHFFHAPDALSTVTYNILSIESFNSLSLKLSYSLVGKLRLM